MASSPPPAPLCPGHGARRVCRHRRIRSRSPVARRRAKRSSSNSDREALAALRRNIAALGEEDRARHTCRRCDAAAAGAVRLRRRVPRPALPQRSRRAGAGRARCGGMARTGSARRHRDRGSRRAARCHAGFNLLDRAQSMARHGWSSFAARRLMESGDDRAVATCDPARWRTRAGARPGHLAHGREPAPRRRGGGRVAARHRARHDPDRYRRDVWQRRRRGDRRPRRRRCARPPLHRQQGLSPQRLAQGRRSPPASAASSGSSTDRIDLYLLHWRGSMPLAETLGRVRAAAARRQNPPPRRQQFRPSRI